VFVTNDGRVKLADFGIAHGPSSSLADAGMVLGTPGYMAPEQVHGLTADARADVFAMGALMYEMLAGRNPFGAGTSDDVSTIMYRTTEADVAPVGDIRPEVPRRLSNLVAKAMARDQGARWRSSEVMAAELARIKPPSGVAGALSAEQHELRQQAGVVSSVVANQASTVQEHLPQKDSTVWIVLGAGAFVVLLLAMIFLLGGSETSGIAVFGLIIAGIGTGVYFMVRSNRRAQPAELEDVFAKVRESEARQVSGHTPDGTLTLSIETRGVRSVHRVSLPLVIGRSSDADLVLADNQMSRRHARLSQRAEDGVVWVEDLGSRNGTWIGTHRADGPSVVPRGAPLRIGDSIFVVES